MAHSESATANRLINDPSPYLLQHAHNPVDWYPWCDEAFEAARKQDKAIFLSVGYSTCHWCHVMAHESFENPHIAQIMNDHFISIKVDREARPDIDEVYMLAVQSMTGGGGWPLSVFLTPQGRPFYGGTYFPPKDNFGRPSFERVLLAIADAWKNNRRELVDSASSIMGILNRHEDAHDIGLLDTSLFDDAFVHLEDSFDSQYGGFGTPKFPSPPYLSFLLAYWWRSGNAKALDMVTKTISSMSRAGIHDHIGGGFHRYATDRTWQTPHFEKMLYDQALISRICLQLFQITKDQTYSQLSHDIFEYVLRDLCSQNGAFYSAQDADSEGHEGTFYLWTLQDIEQVLGKDDAPIIMRYYGISQEGSFEGKNIPHIAANLYDISQEFQLDPQALADTIAHARQKLLAARQKRIRPGLDDKIITGWNGLMIASLAMAGAVLQEPRYTQAAIKAAEFIIENLYKDGMLLRYCRNGACIEQGVLDDYAFTTTAFFELYESTCDTRWLKFARELTNKMCQSFEDDAGGFFMSSKSGPQMIVPLKPAYDGAIPSGNAAAVQVLLRLGRLTMDSDLTDIAVRTFSALAKKILETPTAMCEMLTALNFYFGPAQEIIIAGEQLDSLATQMMHFVQSEFLPTSVWALNDGREIQELLPFISSQPKQNDIATAYICQDYACKEPITEISRLHAVLENLRPGK